MQEFENSRLLNLNMHEIRRLESLLADGVLDSSLPFPIEAKPSKSV